MSTQTYAHLTTEELLRLLRDSPDPIVRELIKRLDEIFYDSH